MQNKFIKFLVDWVWCLPQNLIGALFKLFVKTNGKDEFTDVTIYNTYLNCGSVSLGKHIFLCKGHWGNTRVMKHEFGHYLQNLILGPLYLFVIAIPSLIWAGCFGWYRKKHNVSYYSFYTEKWANKLVKLD